MGKAKKVSKHISFRMLDDVAAAVAEMERAADWPTSRVLNHLARVGLAFDRGMTDDARRLVAGFGMAAFEGQVRAEAEAKIRAARAGDRPDPDQMLIAEAIDSASAADLPPDLALPAGVPERMLEEAAAVGRSYGRGPAAPAPAPLLVEAGVAEQGELQPRRQRKPRKLPAERTYTMPAKVVAELAKTSRSMRKSLRKK